MTDVEFLVEEEKRLRHGAMVDANGATASRLSRFLELVGKYRGIVEELAKADFLTDDCCCCAFCSADTQAAGAKRPESHAPTCLWRRAVEATR